MKDTILDGTLGFRFWPRFRHRMDTVPGDDEWFVVAYSAGGWLYYEWAARMEPSAKSHIKASILVGAPRRNVHDMIQLGTKELDAARWEGPPGETILRGFPPGAALTVILSDRDETVPEDNARFGVEGAREHRVSGVPHEQLMNDDSVLDAIVSEFLRQTEAVPPVVE